MDGSQANFDFDYKEFLAKIIPIWKLIHKDSTSPDVPEQGDLDQIWTLIQKLREFLKVTEVRNDVNDSDICVTIEAIYGNNRYFSPIGRFLTSMEKQVVMEQDREWKKTWIKICSIEVGDLNVRNRTLLDKYTNRKYLATYLVYTQ